jgi:hypothetical protein
MQVNSFKAGYDAYNSYEFKRNDNTLSSETTDKDIKIDIVSISEEAKRLNMQADEKKLLHEPLSQPSWFDKFVVPSSVQSKKVNHDFWNLIGGLISDNTLSSDEKAQIKEYLQNNPVHQSDDKFASEKNSDLKNYITSLHNYFKEALKENGITSKQDYYDKVMLNKNTSEQVHQTMVSKIEKDSNMLKLMNILGVKS